MPHIPSYVSSESLTVAAHAMGRTLVIPPPQHLYLLQERHKDEHDTAAHDEMGFEDFYDISLLQSQKGVHIMQMSAFLAKEAVTGNLKGTLPPDNDVNLWGGKLWKYLSDVADIKPMWFGRFLAFPDRPGDFNLSAQHHPRFKDRFVAFRGQGNNDRKVIYYDEVSVM
jgi:hypothetical protein